MSVSVDWLIRGQVIYNRWWGVCTIEEVHESTGQVLEMYHEYPENVIHTIADTTFAYKPDYSLGDLRQLSTSMLKHPQTGWIILIVNNSTFRMMGNLLLTLTGIRFKLARTYDSAIRELEQVTPTINLSAIDTARIQHLIQADDHNSINSG